MRQASNALPDGNSNALAVQIAGFSCLTNLVVLSMSNNRLTEAASFELPSLAGLLEKNRDSEATADRLQAAQPSVLFPLLQVLKLHGNSIRSLQGLQLYGLTSE